MILANDTWEFCTNGYPDADVWRDYLNLVLKNAVFGAVYYGNSMIGRAQLTLAEDVRRELQSMRETV